MKSKLVSAHNPITGPRHLGHLFGSIIDLVEEQDNHECIIVIDDLLATYLYPREREGIVNRSLFTVKDFLCSGIDASKSKIIFTSKVPEYYELLFYFGTFIDQEYIQELHRCSFTGHLKFYQREELGLPLYPSLTEVVIPQMGIPSITLALHANHFQGGEEIIGYTYIMNRISDSYNSKYGETFSAPKYMPSKLPYVKGTDGQYMIQGNSIILCANEKEIIRSLENSNISPETFSEWYRAMGNPDLADIFENNKEISEKERSNMADQLVEFLRPYRETKITNGEILEIVEQSTSEISETINETLANVRNDFRLLN